MPDARYQMPSVFRLMEIKGIQQTGSPLQLETCNLQLSFRA